MQASVVAEPFGSETRVTESTLSDKLSADVAGGTSGHTSAESVLGSL